MQYDVHQTAPRTYMIVPEGGAPLPILFGDQAHAQRMARWLTGDRSVVGVARAAATRARDHDPAPCLIE